MVLVDQIYGIIGQDSQTKTSAQSVIVSCDNNNNSIRLTVVFPYVLSSGDFGAHTCAARNERVIIICFREIHERRKWGKKNEHKFNNCNRVRDEIILFMDKSVGRCVRAS